MREMRKYRDYLIEELSDPEEAIVYLQTSVEEYQKDGDTVAFLLALQSIAEAQAGNNELVSQVYLLSGEVHHSRGEYDWAIEDYNTVIKLTNTVIEMNPNNVEAYIRRGMAYHHKAEYGSAIENYTKAIELDPSKPQIYLLRSAVYHRKGEYDRAIEDVTKALELNPNNAEVYIYRGLAYQRKGEHDRAIEDYTKAIQLNPNDANVYSHRGVAYYHKDEHDDAIKDFNTAIELNPDNVIAYTYRGMAYGVKSEYDDAIQDYTKAIELYPNTFQIYLSRGVVYHQKGEYDRAIEDATTALELNPDNAEAYMHRGMAYRSKGEYDRAIEDFNRTIQLNPDYADAYNYRGIAHGIKGTVEHTIEDFNKAIELDPSYADAYYNRGIIYGVKGEVDRAIEDFNKAIELDPSYADAYYNRGIIYGVKGEVDRAIEDFNKAIELDPSYADAYYNRGIIYGVKGEVDRAIEDFNKVIELDPSYANAYYNRSVAYRVKGEVDRAIEDYNRAIQLNPDYADIYDNHETAWLHLEIREETRSDRTTARDMGRNIITPFRNDYENVPDFEQISYYATWDAEVTQPTDERSTSRMSEETVAGITKIAMSGFKSLAKECAIDIRPLTILAGANSSGKSSIMQPLLMLKQTLEAPYDPGPLLIEGPNVQFTLAEQFLSKLIGEERTDRFQIRIETRGFDSDFSTTTTFRKGQSGIEIVKMTMEFKDLAAPKSPPNALTVYPEMQPEEVKLIVEKGWIPEGFDVVRHSRCFLDFASQDGERPAGPFTDIRINTGYWILKSIHLPGLRGNPERTYKPTSTGPWYFGTFEYYAASIIHEWQETTDERLKTLADTLHTLGLTGQVGTEKIDDTRIELRVGRLLSPPLAGGKGGGTDMVSIADVGFGVSQVLPALVALIVAEPGQLVYLEQPELHLHPRAQVALAQVLAATAKRGVRVVAETHSSLLLLAVQTLVAEGSLPSELVKLHWFTRGENGATEINTADLDEAGAYGDWPEDFDDVDLKTQSRYIKAAQSRLAERA